MTPQPIRLVAKCHGPGRVKLTNDLQEKLSSSQSTPVKRGRESLTHDQTGSESKRRKLTDSEASRCSIENPRRAIPVTIDTEFFELPFEKPQPVCLNDELDSSAYDCSDSCQWMVSHNASTEFGSTKFLEKIVEDYDSFATEASEFLQRDFVDKSASHNKPLCQMDSIASSSSAQYKTGPRIEQRDQLKQLYRLNRLRPPEKSNQTDSKI